MAENNEIIEELENADNQLEAIERLEREKEEEKKRKREEKEEKRRLKQEKKAARKKEKQEQKERDRKEREKEIEKERRKAEKRKEKRALKKQRREKAKERERERRERNLERKRLREEHKLEKLKTKLAKMSPEELRVFRDMVNGKAQKSEQRLKRYKSWPRLVNILVWVAAAVGVSFGLGGVIGIACGLCVAAVGFDAVVVPQAVMVRNVKNRESLVGIIDEVLIGKMAEEKQEASASEAERSAAEDITFNYLETQTATSTRTRRRKVGKTANRRAKKDAEAGNGFSDEESGSYSA